MELFFIVQESKGNVKFFSISDPCLSTYGELGQQIGINIKS
ncbi:MAG: hypothetical protein US70_C0012G0010 [Parcubacteria group bacterium GW2011_GWD2_38_11]|nr:MAG: hypothetical protein US70_C0012G0010 [Parcubacteria group bacterium GW2011_GWD2_38_11]